MIGAWPFEMGLDWPATGIALLQARLAAVHSGTTLIEQLTADTCIPALGAFNRLMYAQYVQRVRSGSTLVIVKVTSTEFRKNLFQIVERALQGEFVEVVHKGRFVRLVPGDK